MSTWACSSAPDAVLDMIRRAHATTAGTFSFQVIDQVETRNACAVVVP